MACYLPGLLRPRGGVAFCSSQRLAAKGGAVFATIEVALIAQVVEIRTKLLRMSTPTRTGNGLEGLPFHVWGMRHGLG